MEKRRSSDRARPLGCGGFTLLELLIAIFILGVVLSVVYTAYTGTLSNIGEVETRAEIYRMARIAMERMLEDLASASISPGKVKAEPEEQKAAQSLRFLGERIEIDGRRADSLRFASTAHLVFDEGGESAATAEIVYRVRQVEEGEGLALYRADRLAFMAGDGGDGEGLLLCDGLQSVRFSYYDEEGEEYERWDSLEEAFRGRLPARVEIRLAFFRPTSEEDPLRFITGVAIPVSRGENGTAVK